MPDEDPSFMTTTTPAVVGRDPFMPRPPKVRGRAVALAVVAHLLLIAALTLGVNWRSSEPTAISAELWSATPQAAAPRAVEPPPPAVEKPSATLQPPPPPTVKAIVPPTPIAPTPKLPDPQIAIEQARRDEAKRVAANEAAAEKAREQADLAKRKQAADALQAKKAQQAKEQADKLAKAEAAKQLAKTEAANLAKAEAAKMAKAKADKADKQADASRQAARKEQLQRIQQGLAGATGAANATGTALRSSGPSSSYAGRIMAAVKPNIVFTDSTTGNPKATVEVTLAPDGTVIKKRLVKSSGDPSWDDAVLRAIDRTGSLPRDIDGRVPPPFEIDFRPRG